MLKPLTDEQRQTLDRVVTKIPKLDDLERKTYFTIMEVTMGKYLRMGFDVSAYLSIYKTMSRMYEK